MIIASPSAHTEVEENWGSFDSAECYWAPLCSWGLKGIFIKMQCPRQWEVITIQGPFLLCLSHSAVLSSESMARVSKGKLNPAKG